MSTCEITDCRRPVKGLGRCLNHYMQAYRRAHTPGWEFKELAKLLKIISIKPTCVTEECEKPPHANGLCQMHYRRMWREANPRPRRERSGLHIAEGYLSERVKGDGCKTCGLRGPDPCAFCVRESRGTRLHHSAPLF